MFHAETMNDNKREIWPGTEVVAMLKRKLRSGPDLIDMRIIKYDTVGK